MILREVLQKTDWKLHFSATPAMVPRSTGLRMARSRSQSLKTWNPGPMHGRKAGALGSTLMKKLFKRFSFPSNAVSKNMR